MGVDSNETVLGVYLTRRLIPQHHDYYVRNRQMAGYNVRDVAFDGYFFVYLIVLIVDVSPRT